MKRVIRLASRFNATGAPGGADWRPHSSQVSRRTLKLSFFLSFFACAYKILVYLKKKKKHVQSKLSLLINPSPASPPPPTSERRGRWRGWRWVGRWVVGDGRARARGRRTRVDLFWLEVNKVSVNWSITRPDLVFRHVSRQLMRSPLNVSISDFQKLTLALLKKC